MGKPVDARRGQIGVVGLVGIRSVLSVSDRGPTLRFTKLALKALFKRTDFYLDTQGFEAKGTGARRSEGRMKPGRAVRDVLFPLMVLMVLSPCARASLSVYMSPEDLARRAPLVVEGTVIRTASGYDEATGNLATYVTLAVDTVHRGELEEERITLREPGGSYGDLIHDVDAVPVYSLDERVMVFLEPAEDGSLRTAGMFFGKFSIVGDGPRGAPRAVRDLDGQGRIVGFTPGRTEGIPVSDLVAVVATVPRIEPRSPHDRSGPRVPDGDRSSAPRPRRAASRKTWLAEPPEVHRLLWDNVRQDPVHYPAAEGPAASHTSAILSGSNGTGVSLRFTPLSPTAPARWYPSDLGNPVTIDIERTNDPLGDGAAAAAEMRRAMAAWTDVPEARLVLQAGDDDYDYTGSQSESPAQAYTGVNVILFGDPYDDISDPSGCAGVLAIGGYWRSRFTGDPVNNVAFYRAIQMYVIFNNDFECFLGDPDNLAEVATHEIGHGIGFGHSSAPDAIMRATAYGNRGPRLGDDDRDAAHCFYPHTFELLSPNGGEDWEAGTVRTVQWGVTPEEGAEAGEVDLEYSTNGGQDWVPIALDESNDGTYDWTVPDQPGNDVRVRILRRSRGGTVPEIFPTACSLDASDASFSISPPVLVAGSVPAGPGGAGLVLGWAEQGQIWLDWAPSCSEEAEDYAIYEGSLDSLRAGVWDAVPVTCSAGIDRDETISPAAGNRYYLVAPLAGGTEGAYGRASTGETRPVSEAACAARESGPTCE